MSSPRPAHDPALSRVALDVWLDFLGRAPRVGLAELEQLCVRRPELAQQLRELWRTEMADAPPREAAPPPLALEERLRRLCSPSGRATRYRVDGVVAQGGMGVVRRVWDVDLDRALAQKVMLHGGRVLPHGVPASQREPIARFLEEARVTGQLEHPGIVPVHELGVGEDGLPYFTMKLVEGNDLRHVIGLARRGEGGWHTTRLVGVLLRVCEAMAYAHARGVVHRDLKPANVMTGRFGEVYVMDWGVAHVLARGETAHEPVSSLRTGPEPEFATLTDEVLGTPSYMAPEQAGGEHGTPSARVDVYAVGAMLYHVLGGTAPFVAPGEAPESRTVLARLRIGPPRPVGELAPQAPAELRAICEKAMARRSEERYPGMVELADDLRAYLEGRVVEARPVGAFERLRKWILRNRGLAAALGLAAGLGLGGGLAALSWWSSSHDLELLSRLRDPSLLRARYDELWPATPVTLPALRAWQADAERLARERDSYRQELEALRARALPFDPDSPLERQVRRPDLARIARAERLVAHYEAERERLGREGGTTWEGETLAEAEHWIEHFRAERSAIAALTYPRQAWSFADRKDELLHERLTRIQAELDELVGGTATCGLERVRRAIAFASDVRRRSLEDAAEAWSAALASIRDESQCPYGGLELRPQLGLVPLGRDPHSGLWEFAHLQSGAPARRAAGGRLSVDEETGVVLVLVPAGKTHLGAQRRSELEPNHDPFAQPDESPVQAVSLDAFFLSKFELTQAQWRRWSGANPSIFQPASAPESCRSELHPVENVPWSECSRVLTELGLELPSEAQWEYAARAGTKTPWSSGDTPGSLAGYANLLDRTQVEAGADPHALLPGDPPDDGWSHHAPVGSFGANPWGFHDVHGNVLEWCRDEGRTEYSPNYYPGSGERRQEDLGTYVARGGSCESSSAAARSAARRMFGESFRQRNVGVRPALEIRR